jgi:hypothetical protein
MPWFWRCLRNRLMLFPFSCYESSANHRRSNSRLNIYTTSQTTAGALLSFSAKMAVAQETNLVPYVTNMCQLSLFLASWEYNKFRTLHCRHTLYTHSGERSITEHMNHSCYLLKGLMLTPNFWATKWCIRRSIHCAAAESNRKDMLCYLLSIS